MKRQIANQIFHSVKNRIGSTKCTTMFGCQRAHMLLGVAAGLSWLTSASNSIGQGVPLGEAQNFTMISYAGLSNSGLSVINGNVALSPLTTLIGFGPGQGTILGTVHYNDGPAMAARANAITAYNTLAGMAYLPANNLTGMDLVGMTLAPGVYHFETSAQLTGALTLDSQGDPNAVFVIQVGSTLTTSVGSVVNLINGATPTIYWQVGSSTTIGGNTAFSGNIISLASVSLNTGASLMNGRAIALNGALTLLSNSVSSPPVVLAAQGRFWNGTQNNLWSAVNWSTTVNGLDQVVLGTDVDVVFSVNPAPIHQNTILDADTTISSLTVNDPVPVTIGGSNTLTLSASGFVTGININPGAGMTSIESKLTLGNLSQVIDVNNDDGLFISGVVGGSNGLTKAGTGLLTLTGTEIYTGATVVSSGTLQIGNGVVAGSSIASSNSVLVVDSSILAINLLNGETFTNSVTDNGQIQWISPGSNSQAASSVFSGTGSMLVNSPGTTLLLGNNTFSGGTTIDTTGTVLADTSSAFGSGVLTLNNGTFDTNNSQSLQIDVGGYEQTGGLIRMHIEGTQLGTYTQFNVADTANLSGGTVFVYDLSGNYVPLSGDTQNIITTANSLTGEFDSNSPYSRIYNAEANQDIFYHQGDTLLYPTVTYDFSNAYITWVQGSFGSMLNLTRNQTSVGNMLDAYQDGDPTDPTGVTTFLNTQNMADLPGLYDLIAPDELTAMFQIGFTNAEMQNTKIERHLVLARQAPVWSAPPVMTSSSKSGLDSKGGMVALPFESPENKMWNFFVEGTGGSYSVDGDGNGSAYDFDTAGVTAGADRRINDHLIVGFLGSYTDTQASLVDHGSIEVDSYKAAVYATAFANGFYVDALLGFGINDYEISRSSLLGYADSNPDSWELDTLLNAGYDFHYGQWTISPMASLAYTQVNINSFTETGSMTPLSFPDQHQDSLRSNLGARIAYAANFNGMVITPEVRLSWQHEFFDHTQTIDSQFTNGNGPLFTVWGPEMSRERALFSAGVSVQITPSLAIYGFYDGQIGNSNYHSDTVSVGLNYRF